MLQGLIPDMRERHRVAVVGRFACELALPQVCSSQFSHYVCELPQERSTRKQKTESTPNPRGVSRACVNNDICSRNQECLAGQPKSQRKGKQGNKALQITKSRASLLERRDGGPQLRTTSHFSGRVRAALTLDGSAEHPASAVTR